MGRTPAALEAAVASLSSDNAASQLAPEILAKLLAQAPLTRLAARFWATPCVGIKSVRAAIYAIDGAIHKLRAATPQAISSFLLYIKDMLEQRRHLEHLSTHEWSLLWHAIAAVPWSPASCSMVCICWGILLDARASVPLNLEPCLEDLIAVPIDDHGANGVYEGYLMRCLRTLAELLADQKIEITALTNRALELMDRHRVKNILFCQQLALLLPLVPTLSSQQLERIFAHLEPHTAIPALDIQFSKATFSRRTHAEELPWIASRALAHAQVHTQTQTQGLPPGKRHRPSQSLGPVLTTQTQLACFGGAPDHSPPPDQSPSFWYFVWLGLNATRLASEQLVAAVTVTLKSYQQFQDSTPFALAELILELTRRDTHPQLILPQLNAFLAAYDLHPLSSASIYLYRVLKTVGILDQQFQHLIATKLDPWLANSLEKQLETTQLPLGILVDLMGCASIATPDLSKVTPTRGSFITFLGITLYLGQKINYLPPEKLIKADVLALIELCEILAGLGITLPTTLASKLANVVSAAEIEPKISWKAYFLLAPHVQPTIEQFPYAPLPAPDRFREIVAGVFGTYHYNRNTEYIAPIISLMESMDPELPAWQEFYSFLFNTICDQSCFSPLRLPIARIIRSAQDWARLFETSAPEITLQSFKVFKLPKDPGPVLAARVDQSIRTDYLFELAKAGANLGHIVASLLGLGAFDYVVKIADHFKTTTDGLFRDICPKVFLSWSSFHPVAEFPWNLVPESEHLRPYFPISLLPPDWVSDRAMFACYYVNGLRNSETMHKLKSCYSERNFELAVKRNFAEIQYKCWTTLHIPRNEFWKDFPEPQLVDLWLLEVPKEFWLDDQTSCWNMEQLVLSVCRFRREDLYTALRQLYLIYHSLNTPILAISHFIRSCITLAQLASDLVHALEHIVASMAPQLEGPIVSEILVQYPEFSKYFDELEEEGETALELDSVILRLCRGEPITPELFVQSFLDLDLLEFPMYHANYLCSQFEMLDLTNIELNEQQRAALAPRLYRWTRVFKIPSQKWLVFVARLVGEFQPVEYSNTRESTKERMVEELHSFCCSKGYLTRFSLASFMRRLGPGAVVGGTLPTGSVSNLASVKDLTTKLMHAINNGPTDRLLDTRIDVFELSTQLYDRVSTCSLYKALRINPDLGPRIVPYEIARACHEEPLRQELDKVLTTQLANPSTAVQKLILRIIDECYRAGFTMGDCETVIAKCTKLRQGDMALMLAELSRGECKTDQFLPEILEIMSDPDIKSAKSVTPSLETMQLGGWDNLAYSLTCFNRNTASNLRSAGVYRLANLVDKSSYFDYDSAWALGQWDLPPGEKPTSRRELLFSLFSTGSSKKDGVLGDSLNLDRAYVQSWNVDGPASLITPPGTSALPCARDIFSIEKIKGAEKCVDQDLRLAREYFFRCKGDSDALVRDLSLNCQMFCGDRNKEMAIMYAQKLENVVTSMDHEARQMSMVQSASAAWLLGDESTSISMLESIANKPDTRFYQRANVLIKLAEWSAEAHHMSDNALFDQYLEPAVKSALEHNDTMAKASTFHIFAKFCDERFENKGLSAELCAARSMRDEQKGQIQVWKNALREDKENKMAHSKLRKAMQLYEIEQKEYHALKERLRMYLDNSIRFYLKSLQLGVSNTLHDSGRFIALWFANNEFTSLEAIVDHYLEQVPSHMFIPWVNQLTSRLDNFSTGFQKQLSTLVLRLARDHPYHTLWPVFSLSLSESTGSRALAGMNMWRKCAKNEIFGGFGQHMIDVANHKVKPEDKKSFSFSKMREEKKWWTGIGSLRLVSPIENITVNPSCRYDSVPHIQRVDQHISIASGISAPKIIQYTVSDGNMYTMLLKGGNDDLRQDAVMEQVFGHVNSYLQADREAQKRGLKARTYAVIPLGPKAGAIEFVQDTKSLINVLAPLHEDADDREWNLVKARETMHSSFDYGKEARINAYLEVCRHVRPCLGNFFFGQYRDAPSWLQARTNFARSTALMSIVGYILGLGDRHCNNILLDVVSGEVVHIDLGIAFDQGKLLRIPETVPFRLTRDFVDALGSRGTNGVFDRVAEITLGLMRVEEERIMTVLEVLRYDPLYSWAISQSRNRHAQPGLGSYTPKSTDADQALLGVRRKLGEKLNIKATVRELVQQATSSRNLALIFEGWCPFY